MQWVHDHFRKLWKQLSCQQKEDVPLNTYLTKTTDALWYAQNMIILYQI